MSKYFSFLRKKRNPSLLDEDTDSFSSKLKRKDAMKTSPSSSRTSRNSSTALNPNDNRRSVPNVEFAIDDWKRCSVPEAFHSDNDSLLDNISFGEACTDVFEEEKTVEEPYNAPTSLVVSEAPENKLEETTEHRQTDEGNEGIVDELETDNLIDDFMDEALHDLEDDGVGSFEDNEAGVCTPTSDLKAADATERLLPVIEVTAAKDNNEDSIKEGGKDFLDKSLEGDTDTGTKEKTVKPVSEVTDVERDDAFKISVGASDHVSPKPSSEENSEILIDFENSEVKTVEIEKIKGDVASENSVSENSAIVEHPSPVDCFNYSDVEEGIEIQCDDDIPEFRAAIPDIPKTSENPDNSDSVDIPENHEKILDIPENSEEMSCIPENSETHSTSAFSEKIDAIPENSQKSNDPLEDIQDISATSELLDKIPSIPESSPRDTSSYGEATLVSIVTDSIKDEVSNNSEGDSVVNNVSSDLSTASNACVDRSVEESSKNSQEISKISNTVLSDADNIVNDDTVEEPESFNDPLPYGGSVVEDNQKDLISSDSAASGERTVVSAVEELKPLEEEHSKSGGGDSVCIDSSASAASDDEVEDNPHKVTNEKLSSEDKNLNNGLGYKYDQIEGYDDDGDRQPDTAFVDVSSLHNEIIIRKSDEDMMPEEHDTCTSEAVESNKEMFENFDDGSASTDSTDVDIGKSCERVAEEDVNTTTEGQGDVKSSASPSDVDDDEFDSAKEEFSGDDDDGDQYSGSIVPTEEGKLVLDTNNRIGLKNVWMKPEEAVNTSMISMEDGSSKSNHSSSLDDFKKFEKCSASTSSLDRSFKLDESWHQDDDLEKRSKDTGSDGGVPAEKSKLTLSNQDMTELDRTPLHASLSRSRSFDAPRGLESVETTQESNKYSDHADGGEVVGVVEETRGKPGLTTDPVENVGVESQEAAVDFEPTVNRKEPGISKHSEAAPTEAGEGRHLRRSSLPPTEPNVDGGVTEIKRTHLTEEENFLSAVNADHIQAEARLAQRRAARAEARELRLRELEKQQQEQENNEEEEQYAANSYSPQVSEVPSRTPVPRTRASVQTNSISRRSSEDSLPDDVVSSSSRDFKSDLRELEEKFRRAMVATAQLDNEKATLTYEVEFLKDKYSDLEETHTQLTKEHKKKSSENEQLRKLSNKLKEEVRMVRRVLQERDELIQEYGLVLIGEENGEETFDDLDDAERCDDTLNDLSPRKIGVKKALLSQEASELLAKGAAKGSLDVRLRKYAEDKHDLEDEVRRLKMELEEEMNRKRMENGIDNEKQKEVSKSLNEYKFRVQKAEAEVSTLQANVARLESLVARYKASTEELEKSEEELKSEKRRLQRELREAQNRLEELELTASHLQKRFDKLKTARSTLLKDLSQEQS